MYKVRHTIRYLYKTTVSYDNSLSFRSQICFYSLDSESVMIMRTRRNFHFTVSAEKTQISCKFMNSMKVSLFCIFTSFLYILFSFSIELNLYCFVVKIVLLFYLS